MKKILLAATLMVALSTSVLADESSKVNYKVLRIFASEFTHAENVTWKVTNEFAKASFEMEGEKMEAFYSPLGEFLGTSATKAFNKLPKKAINFLSKYYPFPPYQLKECVVFTDAEGNEKNYVSFSNNGKLIVLEVTANGNVKEFKP